MQWRGPSPEESVKILLLSSSFLVQTKLASISVIFSMLTFIAGTVLWSGVRSVQNYNTNSGIRAL